MAGFHASGCLDELLGCFQRLFVLLCGQKGFLAWEEQFGWLVHTLYSDYVRLIRVGGIIFQDEAGRKTRAQAR